MIATQRREINRGKQTEELRFRRMFGIPLWVSTRSWQRILEFQALATDFSDLVSDLHKRVERRIERLLGQPVPKRRRRRLYQVLGIEQLEARMLLSASAVGPEFLVNSSTPLDQKDAAVAMDDAGNFVVTWTSKGQDNADGFEGIYAQQFDAAGVAQGGEFLVNTFTVGDQKKPSVAMDDTGNFVIAWTPAKGRITPMASRVSTRSGTMRPESPREASSW